MVDGEHEHDSLIIVDRSVSEGGSTGGGSEAPDRPTSPAPVAGSPALCVPSGQSNRLANDERVFRLVSSWGHRAIRTV